METKEQTQKQKYGSERPRQFYCRLEAILLLLLQLMIWVTWAEMHSEMHQQLRRMSLGVDRKHARARLFAPGIL